MLSKSISRIRIKNYRSFVEDEVRLNGSQGLIHLSGENLVEQRLGANGAGKSSLLDAICWCISGRGIRGTRTSSLLSWQAAKDAQVEVELDIATNGNSPATIKRYGPPERIEINGKPATQQDVEQLVGISRLRFLHSVIFGQSVRLFPDLDVPERGELLDEVLNLGLWAKASEAAKDKWTELEKKVSEIKQNLSRLEGSLSTLDTVEKLQQLSAVWEQSFVVKLDNLCAQQEIWQQQRESNLSTIRLNIIQWDSRNKSKILLLQQQEEVWKKEQTERLDKLVSAMEELEKEIADLEVNEIETKKLNPKSLFNLKTLTDAEKELSTATNEEAVAKNQLRELKKAEVLWQQSICPVCEQQISNEKKQEKEEFFTTRKIELEAFILQRREKIKLKSNSVIALKTMQQDQLKQATETEANLKSIVREISTKRHQFSCIEQEAEQLHKAITESNTPYKDQIALQQNEINPYITQEQDLINSTNPFLQQIEQASKEINPYIAKIDETEKLRQELTVQKKAEEDAKLELEKQQVAAEYWKQGFKRIRLFFVNEVLLALEIEIQSALSALGLQDWKVFLRTETETKSGSLKFGVQIRVKSPTTESTWDAWSGGETQRLRRGIALGLGSLIQRAAGIRWEQEWHDEITSGLSSQGIEDLLEALRYRAEVMKKSIFLVDHSALTYSSFSSVYQVVKSELGSKVYKIYESEI